MKTLQPGEGMQALTLSHVPESDDIAEMAAKSPTRRRARKRALAQRTQANGDPGRARNDSRRSAGHLGHHVVLRGDVRWLQLPGNHPLLPLGYPSQRTQGLEPFSWPSVE